jgi:putative FmdB family regulatory protein
MPLYEFKCPSCGGRSEKLCPMSELHIKHECLCGTYMERQISHTARPKFGIGIKGHYSREANTIVRSETRGTNDGYDGT